MIIKPRIVTLDIETTPLMGYTWEKWETNVIKVLKRSSILCVSWKWVDENKVHNIAQIDSKHYKPGKEDDFGVVSKLREILDEADVVITQNGNSFDLPILNSRMLVHSIPPPSPYRKIDTKRIAKSIFKFESNKLEDMCKYVGIGQKTNPGGFAAWEGCMAGDKKAWKDMIKYNNNDVLITEQLYLKMRPYMESHPNLNVITERLAACPRCQSSMMQARGFAYTNVSKVRRFQCQTCKGWSRGKPEALKGLVIR